MKMTNKYVYPIVLKTDSCRHTVLDIKSIWILRSKSIFHDKMEKVLIYLPQASVTGRQKLHKPNVSPDGRGRSKSKK